MDEKMKSIDTAQQASLLECTESDREYTEKGIKKIASCAPFAQVVDGEPVVFVPVEMLNNILTCKRSGDGLIIEEVRK